MERRVPPVVLGGEALAELLEWSRDSIGGLGLDERDAEALEKRVLAYADLVRLAAQQEPKRVVESVGANNSAMGQVDGEYCEFHGSVWPCETCTRLGDISRCECIQLGFYGTILCRYHEGIEEGRRQVEEAMAARAGSAESSLEEK